MKRFSSNITDEELCCLFREAAEHYNPKLNDSEQQEAWESIANSLLSEPERRRASQSNKWKKRCIALLMLWLLTGGLTLFRIIQLQESNDQYALDAARAKIILYTPNSTVHLFLTVPEPPTPETHKRKNSQPSAGLAQAELQQTSEGIITMVPAHDSVKKKRTIDNCFNNSYADVSEPSNATDPVTTDTTDIVQATDSSAADTAQAETLPVVTKTLAKPKKNWQIGLVTGVEWNKVSDEQHGAAGWVNGLIIQYRFARRWSVETGILVTPKLYTSRKWAYATLGTFAELKYLDANCRVIDWPLNIRYDFKHQPNSYFFASAGMSSYLMQKEDYTLHYDSFGRMSDTEIESYNKNQHLFATANVSAGYEYQWNRLSLQAAPYVKIPVRDIGVGKARIISGGMLLSLKYSY